MKAEHLAAFDYAVQYIRGLDNAVADVLSQLHLPSSRFALPEVVCAILCHITGEGLTLTEIETATTADEVLSRVAEFIWSPWPPKGQITADLLSYYHIQVTNSS